jgi:hypothetical protein
MEKRHQYPESLLDEENDPAGMICLGRGRRFEGKACPHYVRDSGACLLLRDRGIVGLIEFKRCLTEKELLWRLFRLLRSFGQQVASEMLGLQEFLHGRPGDGSVRPITGLLRKMPPKETIDSLYGFVNVELYQYTKEVLRRRGLITGRRRCGNCKHLPSLEPRTCQLRDFLDDSTDTRTENPHFGKLRKAHSLCCKGYEALAVLFNPIASDEPSLSDAGSVRLSDKDTDKPWERDVSTELTVHEIWNLMEQCRSRAATPKKRAMETRRLEDFRFLYAQYEDGKSIEAAKALLLDQKASTPKERDKARMGLARDLEAVEKCLTQAKTCH